jgi:hypothetical protein
MLLNNKLGVKCLQACGRLLQKFHNAKRELKNPIILTMKNTSAACLVSSLLDVQSIPILLSGEQEVLGLLLPTHPPRRRYTQREGSIFGLRTGIMES